MASILAGFFLMMMAMMAPSRQFSGVHKPIFNIFLFGVYITIFYPFTILSVYPEIYRDSGLTKALAYGVPSSIHLSILCYTAGIVIAFYLGMWLFSRKCRPLVGAFKRDKKNIGTNRGVFLTLAVVGLVFQLILDQLGAQTIDGRGTYGMFMRLVPSSSLLCAVCFLLTKYKSNLGTSSVVFCVGYLLLFILVNILAGRRGVVLVVPFMFFITTYILRPDYRFRGSLIAGLAIFFVAIVPVSLAVSTVTKNVAKETGFAEREFSKTEASEILSNDIYYRYFRWSSGRFRGYQAAVVLESNKKNEIFGEQVKPQVIFYNVIRILFPDRFLPSWVPRHQSLGKTAGMVIGGASVKLNYSSSWYGMPFLKGFFGWLGLCVIFFLGYFLAWIPYWVFGKNEVLSVIFIGIIYNSAWSFHISGNLDILLAEFVQYNLVFYGFTKVMVIISSIQSKLRMNFRPPGVTNR
ncbi:hypothetical protein N8485_01265 [Akkermansiaceae bacterium]|nr:hypothetical protein [Akkermansiaceae bacterium]